MVLDNGERNLLVSGLNRLLADPIDPMVNPQDVHDAVRALRDRIVYGDQTEEADKANETHMRGAHPGCDTCSQMTNA